MQNLYYSIVILQGSMQHIFFVTLLVAFQAASHGAIGSYFSHKLLEKLAGKIFKPFMLYHAFHSSKSYHVLRLVCRTQIGLK